ncbi:ArsC/Spx/MgsR family protein [Candidatus Puniceispirillum sp.]|jgi:arsenate reductase (glutaredoxin)|uniref:arsenate reductase family protein n=1 Tax=Candidatus Puniceispirillum sp. TaxID=2026719 RepID=UPI002FCE5522
MTYTSLTIYALKTCDSCKKAIATLRAYGHDVTVIDVRADGVPHDLLDNWLTMHGADVMINRKSTTWRGFDEATRHSDPLTLLKDHPTLMKRPVIVDTENVYVGWGKDVQSMFGN